MSTHQREASRSENQARLGLIALAAYVMMLGLSASPGYTWNPFKERCPKNCEPNNRCIAPKTWSVDDPWPEQDEDWLPDASWLAERKLGVAFSGGGSRSAAATLGQLRALHLLEWHDDIKYISAVSGGAWTAVPYTFLQKAHTDEAFLGDYCPPSSLDSDCLEGLRGSFSEVIDGIGFLAPKYLWAQVKGRGDESYSETIAKELLEDHHLYDRESFFAFSEGARERLQAADDSISKFSFVVPDPSRQRPFLVVGGVRFNKDSDDPEHRYPVEMTPIYTGSRSHPKGEGNPEGRGGYVASYGYDSCGVSGSDRAVLTNTKRTFTLADVLGITSSAPQEMLLSLRLLGVGLPRLGYWDPTEGPTSWKTDVSHGDGGSMDNLGIMPLLIRKTEKMLVFVNAATPFRKDLAKADVLCRENEKGKIEYVLDSKLLSFFAYDETDLGCIEEKPLRERYPHNEIFSMSVLKSMMDEFRNDCNDKEGACGNVNALVHCGGSKVDPSDEAKERYGIPKSAIGLKPDICWVYLENAGAWSSMLPEKSPLTKRSMEDFPHFNTFVAKGSRTQIADLDRVEVETLTQFTTWAVCSSAETIAEGLGLEASEFSRSCKASL